MLRCCRRKLLGSHHPDVAKTLNALGAAAELQGQLEQARGHYQQAFDILDQVLSREHTDTYSAYLSLMSCLERQGKMEETRKLEKSQSKGPERAVEEAAAKAAAEKAAKGERALAASRRTEDIETAAIFEHLLKNPSRRETLDGKERRATVDSSTVPGAKRASGGSGKGGPKPLLLLVAVAAAAAAAVAGVALGKKRG